MRRSAAATTMKLFGKATLKWPLESVVAVASGCGNVSKYQAAVFGNIAKPFAWSRASSAGRCADSKPRSTPSSFRCFSNLKGLIFVWGGHFDSGADRPFTSGPAVQATAKYCFSVRTSAKGGSRGDIGFNHGSHGFHGWIGGSEQMGREPTSDT